MWHYLVDISDCDCHQVFDLFFVGLFRSSLRSPPMVVHHPRSPSSDRRRTPIHICAIIFFEKFSTFRSGPNFVYIMWIQRESEKWIKIFLEKWIKIFLESFAVQFMTRCCILKLWKIRKFRRYSLLIGWYASKCHFLFIWYFFLTFVISNFQLSKFSNF